MQEQNIYNRQYSIEQLIARANDIPGSSFRDLGIFDDYSAHYRRTSYESQLHLSDQLLSMNRLRYSFIRKLVRQLNQTNIYYRGKQVQLKYVCTKLNLTRRSVYGLCLCINNPDWTLNIKS